MNDETPGTVDMATSTYEASGGLEHFISVEDFDLDLLIGFCRLRFPNEPVRRELEDAAVVRELHVYGNEVGVGADGDATTHQHEGYGRRLIHRAEDLAAEAGYSRLAVISGIGARQYYREKLGYHQDGPYVSKRLD